MPDVHATLRSIADARRDDPLRPVTVVAPSHAAALQMRRRLAELTPFAAVRFETFPRLAELLGAGHLAADGRRPLARPIGDYLAGQVAGESQGTLAAVRDLAGYARVLRQLFRRLRRAGITSSDAIRGGYPDHAREIFRLYDRFREASAGFYDEEDLLDAAAAAVETGRAGALGDLGAIYVAPPGALTAAGTHLLEALRTAAPGFEEIEEAPARPQSQRFLLAPDPASEARCVVREVIGAIEEGVAIHEIGVFHGADSSYGKLLREAFAESGVPVAPMPGLPLIETRAGRGVLALASLPERDFSRAAAMEFLSIAPLKDYLPAAGGSARLLAHDWDRLSRAAGITRGKDAWEGRLGAFIGDKEAELQSSRVAENEAPGRAVTYQRDQAEQLRAVMSRLLERLEPLRRAQAAESFIEAFRAIVADYFDPSDRALENVIEEIDQLGTVGAVGGEFSLDTFSAALRANLELAFSRERGLGDGVVIAEYRVAAGLEFRRAVLCGAYEGALPAGPGGDAILDDRVWQGLKQDHPFTEDATTRIQRARESAERAVGAAAGGHLTWSAPSHEPGGARDYYPSPMMAEAYSAVVGSRVTASKLREDVSDIVSRPGSALGSMLSGPLVDVAELHLRDAVHRAQSGGRIPAEDPRARPLALLQARRSPAFTEWDGNVAGIDGDLLVSEGKTVSPTSLETYGVCGYRYFARSVLRLNVVEEPDEREMMDAAERGSVIHRVLERFFRDQQERGRPAINETWTPADQALLLQIADEELANAAARGQTGLGVYSRHEARNIRADLRAFLIEDNAFRQETGAVPAEFERDVPPTEIAGVTLRGRVDRIDRTPDGRAAWVIDYKSGSTYEFRGLINGKKGTDPLLGGRKLQLPTYLAAAADAEAAVAMYWFITRSGGFERAEYPRDAGSEERFEKTVQAIVGGIRSGSFPAVPEEEDEWRGGFNNCKFCKYDRICSRRRDIEFSSKASDPAAQAWQAVQLTAEGDTS